MSTADAQKSEVHDATADADASPTAAGDAATTKAATGHGRAPADKPRDFVGPDVRVIDDQTDDGGPLTITSDDPALNPPRVARDPFPTDRTPEIDPPAGGRKAGDGPADG